MSGTSTPSVLRKEIYEDILADFGRIFLDEVVASLQNRQKYECLISELTFYT